MKKRRLLSPKQLHPRLLQRIHPCKILLPQHQPHQETCYHSKQSLASVQSKLRKREDREKERIPSMIIQVGQKVMFKNSLKSKNKTRKIKRINNLCKRRKRKKNQQKYQFQFYLIQKIVLNQCHSKRPKNNQNLNKKPNQKQSQWLRKRHNKKNKKVPHLKKLLLKSKTRKIKRKQQLNRLLQLLKRKKRMLHQR